MIYLTSKLNLFNSFDLQISCAVVTFDRPDVYFEHNCAQADCSGQKLTDLYHYIIVFISRMGLDQG